MIESGYRAVWIFAMFDLPTDTKKARKDYTYFRKNLLKDGFGMLQYSVYVRHCASEENAAVHYQRIRNFLPPDGEVRLVTITDKQFARMEAFWGKMRKPTPPAPKQLELF
ncbi:MAG: CRISPR-associated endonuclease Cas2 [Planctomycetota bacterium]|jgi:CRISPR-associated protein Cas2